MISERLPKTVSSFLAVLFAILLMTASGCSDRAAPAWPDDIQVAREDLIRKADSLPREDREVFLRFIREQTSSAPELPDLAPHKINPSQFDKAPDTLKSIDDALAWQRQAEKDRPKKTVERLTANSLHVQAQKLHVSLASLQHDSRSRDVSSVQGISIYVSNRADKPIKGFKGVFDLRNIFSERVDTVRVEVEELINPGENKTIAVKSGEFKVTGLIGAPTRGGLSGELAAEFQLEIVVFGDGTAARL